MPDAHEKMTLATAPQAICDELGTLGCILLTYNADGSIGFSGHGMDHLKANELLSVGIHMNLTQYDLKNREPDVIAAAPVVKLVSRNGAPL